MAEGQLSTWAEQELDPDFSEATVSFSIRDPRNGGGGRLHVEIADRKVIISRELASGCHELCNIASLDDYLGVGIALGVTGNKAENPGQKAENPGQPAMMILLEHEDENLALPLYVSWTSDSVLDKWQGLARQLGLLARVRGMADTSHNPVGKICGVDFSPTKEAMHEYRANAARQVQTRSARRASLAIVGGRDYGAREIVTRH